MGTTSKIYFPRVQPTAVTTSVEIENKVAEPDLHGSETILLVEDESAVRFAALAFLKKCGYLVLEGKDGLSAVEAASNHNGPIDLMVTDVVMPGMSGRQLAEMLAEKYPNIRVLFMSGYAETVMHSHKIMDLELGCGFLQKALQSARSGTQGARAARQECRRGRSIVELASFQLMAPFARPYNQPVASTGQSRFSPLHAPGAFRHF